jgi:hypothetical protein
MWACATFLCERLLAYTHPESIRYSKLLKFSACVVVVEQSICPTTSSPLSLHIEHRRPHRARYAPHPRRDPLILICIWGPYHHTAYLDASCLYTCQYLSWEFKVTFKLQSHRDRHSLTGSNQSSFHVSSRRQSPKGDSRRLPGAQ